jgi:hypothetical protein
MTHPTHTVCVVDTAGRMLALRKEVPTDAVLDTVIALLRRYGWQGLRVTIDGKALTEAADMRTAISASGSAEDVRSHGPTCLTSSSKFLLTDDHVLHRLPLIDDGAGDPVLRSGKGPGPLVWEPIEEHGMCGLAAAWQRGTFKILRLGSGQCALFYERGARDWDALALGAPDALKKCAGARAGETQCAPPLPDFMVRAIWANVAALRRKRMRA